MGLNGLPLSAGSARQPIGVRITQILLLEQKSCNKGYVASHYRSIGKKLRVHFRRCVFGNWLVVPDFPWSPIPLVGACAGRALCCARSLCARGPVPAESRVAPARDRDAPCCKSGGHGLDLLSRFRANGSSDKGERQGFAPVTMGARCPELLDTSAASWAFAGIDVEAVLGGQRVVYWRALGIPAGTKEVLAFAPFRANLRVGWIRGVDQGLSDSPVHLHRLLICRLDEYPRHFGLLS
jgi:hypothetical protein